MFFQSFPLLFCNSRASYILYKKKTVQRLLRTFIIFFYFEKSASPQRSLLFLGSISYFVRCNLTEGKFGASYFSSEVDIFTDVIVYIYIPMFSHHSCSYSSIFFWSPKKEEQKQGNVKWDETSGNWLRVQKNAALLLLHHPDWFYFQEMSGLFCPNILAYSVLGSLHAFSCTGC